MLKKYLIFKFQRQQISYMSIQVIQIYSFRSHSNLKILLLNAKKYYPIVLVSFLTL